MNARQQHANRLAIAAQDFDDALKQLNARRELQAAQCSFTPNTLHALVEAALFAAIVAYVRPFKTSRSGSNADAKLEPGDLDALTNQSAMVLHEMIIAIRDQLVAHSDWARRNTNLVKSSPGMTIRRMSVPTIQHELDVIAFHELLLKLRAEVIVKGNQIDMSAVREINGGIDV
jgi:hypothetical protein